MRASERPAPSLKGTGLSEKSAATKPPKSHVHSSRGMASGVPDEVREATVHGSTVGAGVTITHLRYSLAVAGDDLKTLMRRAGIDRKQYDRRTRVYLVPTRCLTRLVNAANDLGRPVVVHGQATR